MWADLARAARQQAEAAPDAAEARRWLERAHRITPDDATITLSLGLSCLRGGDPRRAAGLFEEILRRHDLMEARAGLAASALQLDQPARAMAAMQLALAGAATPPVLQPLAAAVARAAGLPGWCAVGQDGWLHADAAADLVLDGRRLRPRWAGARCRIPSGRRLEVTRGGVALLGSPLDLAAIGALEGFVQAAGGGLVGWAWFPNHPARDPVLTLTGAGRSLRIAAREQPGGLTSRPLARPRQFRLAAEALPPGAVQVTGPDGRHLLGSPLDPGMERRSAAGLDARFQPVWADVAGPPPLRMPRRRKVDVVVPVYAGVEQTIACLDSVLAALPDGSRVHVVDDASPDPAMAAALAALAMAARRVRVIRQPASRGFPAAANAGLAAAAGRDVVLLNSDTLVAPGWLEALRDAAYGAPDIGTACPLSNEATILSYPDRDGGNPMPDLAQTVALAALARRANGTMTVDIPVAVGSCMLIRRDCLDQVGPLREDLFAQGYGEENDFCLRARHRGWRHVAVAGMFVAHAGGVSFGAARRHLQDRNAAVLERLHPGYGALVEAWRLRDPLGPARRAMDALRWRQQRSQRSAILVAHAGGGGVDRMVAARAEALREQGITPVLLRPDGGVVVVGDGGFPNLRFAVPAEWGALVRLLRAGHPTHVELHHLLGHAPALLGLAAALRVPADVFVHDYAWFCPRIALVPQHAYCGEPEVAVCEACVADHGSNLEEAIAVPDLVRRSAEVLAAARRVVAPAADVVTRMRRHFPEVRAETMPWEDDAAIAPPPATPAGAAAHVCIVGGIGVEKGYEVLLACVRDARARRLGLAFTVVGHTADDERLLAAGPVFITGGYAEAEAVALIREQRASLAWLPSIWPETWCFTLGLAWRAGLRAAVFDIGAPAERVRRTGWGWVLPLGLPAASINDWLLRQCTGVRATSAR